MVVHFVFMGTLYIFGMRGKYLGHFIYTAICCDLVSIAGVYILLSELGLNIRFKKSLYY